MIVLRFFLMFNLLVIGTLNLFQYTNAQSSDQEKVPTPNIIQPAVKTRVVKVTASTRPGISRSIGRLSLAREALGEGFLLALVIDEVEQYIHVYSRDN